MVANDLHHRELARKLLQQNRLLASKISRNCQLSPNDVPSALSEVLRFLHLIALSGETLTPSVQVDDVWHEFILFTKAYTEFCQRHFGRYIHHQPSDSKERNSTQFQRTLKLYRQHFGEPVAQFWRKRAISANQADCGACEGDSRQQ